MHGALRHWQYDTFRCDVNFPPPSDWLLRFIVIDGQAQRLEIERVHWPEAMPVFHRVE